jgi:ABC-type glycerol-3-phosphate transport system substrate-binding protein
MRLFKTLLPVAVMLLSFTACQSEEITSIDDQSATDVAEDITESESRTPISPEVWEAIINDFAESIDNYKTSVRSDDFNPDTNDKKMIELNSLQSTIDEANKRGELTVDQINRFAKLKQKLSLVRVGGS